MESNEGLIRHAHFLARGSNDIRPLAEERKRHIRRPSHRTGGRSHHDSAADDRIRYFEIAKYCVHDAGMGRNKLLSQFSREHIVTPPRGTGNPQRQGQPFYFAHHRSTASDNPAHTREYLCLTLCHINEVPMCAPIRLDSVRAPAPIRLSSVRVLAPTA